MPFDANCYDACIAGCLAVCGLIPPPLGEALIVACGVGCLAACNTDNIVLNEGIVDPEFPFQPPEDTEA